MLMNKALLRNVMLRKNALQKLQVRNMSAAFNVKGKFEAAYAEKMKSMAGVPEKM